MLRYRSACSQPNGVQLAAACPLCHRFDTMIVGASPPRAAGTVRSCSSRVARRARAADPGRSSRALKAISSGQAMRKPCRFSSARTNSAASTRLSGVPVSSQAIAAAHQLDVQLAALEIGAVDVGDLEFAARRRLEAGGDVDHLLVVEIEPGHGPVRLRLLRLLLDRDRAAVARRTRRRRSARDR